MDTEFNTLDYSVAHRYRCHIPRIQGEFLSAICGKTSVFVFCCKQMRHIQMDKYVLELFWFAFNSLKACTLSCFLKHNQGQLHKSMNNYFCKWDFVMFYVVHRNGNRLEHSYTPSTLCVNQFHAVFKIPLHMIEVLVFVFHLKSNNVCLHAEVTNKGTEIFHYQNGSTLRFQKGFNVQFCQDSSLIETQIRTFSRLPYR